MPNTMLKKLKERVEAHQAELHALSNDIWTHPEIAYTEKYAVAQVTALLQKNGFSVVSPYCGIETAFRCEYDGGEGPVFAFCSEYDALPEIGHGCGHNLICIAGIAAFLALTELMRANSLPGKVVLFGTPAEEGGGGKVKMEAAGCLKGIDAVAMVHPTAKTSPDPGSTANCGLEIIFHGKSVHAASPENGINALDAMTLLYAGVNCFRQQLPEHARIHGVVLEGGLAPNIIPDCTRCRFYLRTGIESWAPVLERRFRDIVRGAELMTGCTAEIRPFRPPYRARKPNAPMNETYVESLREMGMAVNIPEHAGRGSSDFGNFSQVIPGIHAYFAVSNTSEPPGHSVDFCTCAGQDAGFSNALNAAAAIAYIGYRYLTEPEYRTAVQKDFANS